MIRRPPRSTPFPTRRSSDLPEYKFNVIHMNRPDGQTGPLLEKPFAAIEVRHVIQTLADGTHVDQQASESQDRKSTRLNSSHSQISYAVFCLKKKTCNRPYKPTSALQSPSTLVCRLLLKYKT